MSHKKCKKSSNHDTSKWRPWERKKELISLDLKKEGNGAMCWNELNPNLTPDGLPENKERSKKKWILFFGRLLTLA